MLNITLKNKTCRPYSEVRDEICKSLVGNRGYIENDIIVSDCLEDENIITFSLGDDCTPVIEICGEISEIKTI